MDPDKSEPPAIFSLLPSLLRRERRSVPSFPSIPSIPRISYLGKLLEGTMEGKEKREAARNST